MEYLRAALEDEDEHTDAVFLLALRDVAQANHMTYVAEVTGLNRESLYKMLSQRGNPGINSLKAVLNAVGLKLSVEVAPQKEPTRDLAVASWYAVQTTYDFHQQGEHIPLKIGLLSLPSAECEAGWEAYANPPPAEAGGGIVGRRPFQ